MTLHAGASEILGPDVVESVLVVLAEFLIAAVPVTLIILWLRDRPAKLIAIVVLTSVVAGLVVSYGLGLLYSHPAPYELQPATVLSGTPENAFPSQHAAVAFGMVWPLHWLRRRRLAAGFVVIAVLVSLGRIATGLHFPVDVAGGLVASLVGFGFVWLVSDSVTAVGTAIVDFEARAWWTLLERRP